MSQSSEKVQREPKPTDILPGTTQFLRYRNGYVRGSWNGPGASVSLTWHSGFFTSIPVDAWNDRTFLENGARAVLLSEKDTPDAIAFFAKMSKEAKSYQKASATDKPDETKHTSKPSLR